MSATAKVPVRMTVAEFFAWDAGDGHLWQLVDGEPQAMAPANRTHGAIQAELCSLIRNHLSERSSLCGVVVTPGVVPRVQADHNVWRGSGRAEIVQLIFREAAPGFP